MSKISDLVLFAKTDTTNTYKDVNFGTISNAEAQEVTAKTGVSVKGCIKYLTASGIRHALNSHSNPKLEAKKRQFALTDADFEKIPEILTSPDYLVKGNNNQRGNDAVEFIKKYKNKDYHVLMSVVYERGEKKLVFNTMYIKDLKVILSKKPMH